MSMTMMADTEKRWKVAQASELEYWQKPDTIERHGDAAKRREYWQPYLDFIASQKPLGADDAILDIGCGPTGILTAFEAGRKVGLDPLIDDYRDKYDLDPSVEYIKSGGESIDLPDTTFDHVFCLNALDHCLRPESVLEESLRLLKPGGLFTLAIDVYPASWRKWKAAFSAHVKVSLLGRQELHPHKFVRADVVKMLQRVGFETKDDRCVGGHRYTTELVFLAQRPA